MNCTSFKTVTESQERYVSVVVCTFYKSQVIQCKLTKLPQLILSTWKGHYIVLLSGLPKDSHKSLNFYKMPLVEYWCKLENYTQFDLLLCATHTGFQCLCSCINHHTGLQHRIYPTSSSLMYPPMTSAGRMLLTLLFQELWEFFYHASSRLHNFSLSIREANPNLPI